MAQKGLKVTLLLDESNGVNTFIHANAILPIVAAMGILRLVLNTDGFRRAHVTPHDLLLDGTSLNHGFIHGIATLLNAVATQVSASRTRIAHYHGKVTRFIAL